jgi:hypothetical protein
VVCHGCFQFPNSLCSAILGLVSRVLRLMITKHNHNHRSKHLTVVEPQDSLKPAETPAFQTVDKLKENHFFLPDVLESTNMHRVLSIRLLQYLWIICSVTPAFANLKPFSALLSHLCHDYRFFRRYCDSFYSQFAKVFSKSWKD